MNTPNYGARSTGDHGVAFATQIDHDESATTGSTESRLDCVPPAVTSPSATARAHGRRPVARASQVAASVSITLGGVPRVWRTPATHWVAPWGGTRISPAWPG